MEFARIPIVLGILANPTTPEISVEDALGSAGHVVANTPIVVRAAALHGDGIVLAGNAKVGNSMAFSRIHMDGSVDSSFGVNGLAVVGPEYNGSQLFAVAVGANGSIVGAGEKSVVRVLASADLRQWQDPGLGYCGPRFRIDAH